MKTSFPCSGCGACCRKIDRAVKNAKELDIDVDLSFPYKWDEKGVCEMLEDNKCKIYEDRPLLCRIDDLQKLLEDRIGKEEFYRLTAQACNSLIDEFKLDKSFKIKI